MGPPKEPRLDLARETLPPVLFKALCHVFGQNISGCVLAGEIALSGFYAARRRSQDLEFFAEGELPQRGAVLAVKSLASASAVFHDVYETNQFFRGTCAWEGDRFTVTVVTDSHLFVAGKFITLENGVSVADLPTLLKMKAATLVSRCSEKDLYDLIWLFQEFEGLALEDVIRLGQEIDTGVTGEAMLLSLSGTVLSEEACDFSLSREIPAKAIHGQVVDFQKKLIRALSVYLKDRPVPPLGELVRKLTRLR